MKITGTILLITFVFLTNTGHAQFHDRNNIQPSPANILKSDGTIDVSAGFSGSFDLSRYQMISGPGGQPVFIHGKKSDEDDNWDKQFIRFYPDGPVYALFADGTDIYIGGDFTADKINPANYIAKWNGTAFSALGTGVNGPVHAIAIIGTDIYVGGEFTMAGEITANNIARWDGTNWSALGDGVNGIVKAIGVSEDFLCIGGSFTVQTQSGETRNLAVWLFALNDQWSHMAEKGLNNTVHAISVSGKNVYVGGEFTEKIRSDGMTVPAPHFVRFQHQSISFSMHEFDEIIFPSDPNPIVLAITLNGTDVYFGGSFYLPGKNVYNIAKLDGTGYSAMGNGVYEEVYSIAIEGDNLYAGGRVIEKWDGTSWSPLGNELDKRVLAMEIIGTTVYLGGDFNDIDGNPMKYVSKWNGTSFSAFGNGINNGNGVYAIAAGESELYLGGSFTVVGDLSVNNIAKWDGMTWSSPGGGLNSEVNAIAISGNNVYAGGTFTQAGETSANRIAKWNGTEWTGLGSGISNGEVLTIAINGNNIYAGGFFTQAGGNPANNIAMWNGSGWSALGNGVNNIVRTIAIFDDEVYAGGHFLKAGDNQDIKFLARWDGETWQDVGGGVNSSVNVLTVSDNHLFAGGNFTQAGGSNANYIARWNGTKWSAPGSGLNGSVFAITLKDNILFAGGYSTPEAGNPANQLATWDGINWSVLGSGMNELVTSITPFQNSIFVGGWFTRAGELPSYFLSRWMNITSAPANQATNIQLSNIESVKADITWTNGNGEGRAVFMVEGNDGTVEPVNNTTYAANSIFGSGDQTGSGGWYCMYNGTSNNVTVTGLSPNTTYRVMVCEYNGSTGNEKYNTSDATGNPESFSTLLTNIENYKENQPLQFHIYPNPFSDNIYLENAEMTEKVIITNILGQNLRSLNNKGSLKLIISTEGLHRGIYLVNIYTVKGELIVKRIVKYK